jgi:hypothetical protein
MIMKGFAKDGEDGKMILEPSASNLPPGPNHYVDMFCTEVFQGFAQPLESNFPVVVPPKDGKGDLLIGAAAKVGHQLIATFKGRGKKGYSGSPIVMQPSGQLVGVYSITAEHCECRRLIEPFDDHDGAGEVRLQSPRRGLVPCDHFIGDHEDDD